MHQIPIPFASLGSAAYLIGRNMQQLRHLRFPSPASIFGALAIDAGLHMGRLAYQFHVATKESHERAETLAFRLLQLREKYDKIRLVGHSLGCRHIVEACSLLTLRDRPNEIHLCAPALVRNDILPMVAVGSGGIGQQNTMIYYSHKDVTLGVLFRALVAGDQAIGEIGLPDEPLDPSVLMIDASRSLGGYYVGSHTDYADKFHFMCAATPTNPPLDPKE
ncbi:hypothetical protein BC940DRAFT_240795 [Gongronella butleri]|nr:hypothetical protein BC940DRAFT_240795 [Gongronella butleri]